ncbi:MAG TPA: alpha-2-macroglobulin family protein, partial [Polyangia bacterium]|nr:alpha-2-macroglobulin family protein [Polyangia bacterium]
YALPKFNVLVSTDKPWYTPGATVSGAVDAIYFFGKAAAGADVQIEAATMDIGLTVFQKVIGKTDAQGRYAYSVKLPAQLVGLPINDSNAAIDLRVQVTDTAGQQVVQEQTVTVASKTLRIALVPEGTAIVPGLDNHIDVFVTDPLGSPAADAAVEVSAAGTPIASSGRSDAFGHFSFTWNPAASAPTEVTVKVTSKDGTSVSEPFSLKNQNGTAPLLVRTDKAVYSVGDTVAVDVITSKDENSVYIDWANNGQTVDMRTLDVVGGTASFKATLDTSHLGTNRIDAYIVGPDGNIVRTGRTIFVRGQGSLSVETTTDKTQYQPGKPAQITFSIKDETGAPAVAALGVQVVDQAVFALVDARPGLLRTYFELEEQFAQPSYEIRPPVVDLESLLYNETAASDPATASAAQNRAAAVFASLGDAGITGMRRGSWAALGPKVMTLLAPYYVVAKQRLLGTVSQATVAAIDTLKQAGCNPSSYYCSAKSQTFYSLLQAEVSRRLTGSVFDFWGNPYRSQVQYMEVITLLTSGPDEKPGTDDDGSISFAITDLDLPAATKSVLGMGGYGIPSADAGVVLVANAGPAMPPAFAPPPMAIDGAGAAGGAMALGTGTATGTAAGTGGTSGGDEPRVRKDFPETLYVNPQLITGSDGKASISVDMADSITEWRVSSLAHTMGGKMGGGVGAIRVFQEFFVDIDFPATLTRGDEVNFPVAVYNYLDKAQTVRVEIQTADWFTPLGGTGMDIDLGPGQVTGVRFPVRVDKVGRQT